MKKEYSVNLVDITAYLLMVICFPLNPLVFLNIIEPNANNTLTCIGFIIWAFGMLLVVYPFFYFRVKGGVKKDRSYVHTSNIVTTGLYSVVRHVQYTGGIISIFIATPFIYPHWIFIVLGIPGIYLTYLGTKREDNFLVEKFGTEYKKYMEKVPAMNIFVGLYKKIMR
ncbi:MAG TPA: isoprenylcysteine carboxylmethyltransferase family protein [Tenuifilaceae bacterium]|nr:isoprenylcysteine carboxylmethyltransferase family protein [Tenuifilaceae bacterium]HPE18578.1 isoprenylcysteine carboxylmethyltransferase family protein [Tenuifilaceae bacterium]HPJ46103.1 isoprenylcysteine carboxylmethyltransferase family protein [Tenuifilaceae bacterium]HPQ34412.1 isoprenylcysteine carboxylmethyltransferase family protein [Tenuifilaceae bacterium]HRX67808.1 isoprenylcysteine carboxylmethyltransferase family protein [Tenuifilaceae bacterium]